LHPPSGSADGVGGGFHVVDRPWRARGADGPRGIGAVGVGIHVLGERGRVPALLGERDASSPWLWTSLTSYMAWATGIFFCHGLPSPLMEHAYGRASRGERKRCALALERDVRIASKLGERITQGITHVHAGAKQESEQ
jgi:hypothetical protein